MAEPFSVDHFCEWAAELTLDTGDPWVIEPFQRGPLADLFGGFREVWMVIPEGNAKTTLVAGVALYYLEHQPMASVPVAASSREQAEILYRQAEGFVLRSERMHERMDDPLREAKGKRAKQVPRFECQEGFRRIRHFEGGRLQVFAADDRTGDGVIPTLCVVDELHRHRDLRLYRVWRGKLDKRDGQIIAISTAGEPETEFEETRERIRNDAGDRERDGAYLRATNARVALHEWMLEDGKKPDDFRAVKAANPLSALTPGTLKAKFNDPTQDLSDWMRLVCNRPTRSVQSAITEAEFDSAFTKKRIPAGESVSVGLDVAWKWDTTAIVPMWVRSPVERLIDRVKILTPPRDGNTLDPREIEVAFTELHERNPISMVVMDMSKAEQLSVWLENELGVEVVVDRGTSNVPATEDYEAFMEALREGWLKHTGGREFRRQVLNAVAIRLPGDKKRFDRPNRSRTNMREQDRRVIDCVTAAAMVNFMASAAVEQFEGPLVEVFG